MKKPPETIEEFEALWAAECEEWMTIRDEMAASSPTAADVSNEQRKRMAARGELPVMDCVFARRLVTRAVARGVGR